MFELYNNLCKGNFPISLVNVSKLFVLDMSKNNFTGVVPSSIGKLKELSLLNLEFNQFHAHDKQDWDFMHSLFNCTKLQVLSLDANKLEGKIPICFGNISMWLQ